MDHFTTLWLPTGPGAEKCVVTAKTTTNYALKTKLDLTTFQVLRW